MPEIALAIMDVDGISSPKSKLPRCNGTLGGRSFDDDEVQIVEPPAKKTKCSPSTAKPKPAATLHGHLTVIKDPFQVLMPPSNTNGSASAGRHTVTSPRSSASTEMREAVTVTSSSPASASKLETQQERLRQKEEKEREKQLAQSRKLYEKLKKQEEKELKDQERKEKEEERKLKKEQELKEKLERQEKREYDRKRRESIQRAKDKERQKKEEERLKREEERNAYFEQKRQKQEDEDKKKIKAKNAFKSFFIAKSPSPKQCSDVHENDRFQPFELKPNMSLAPCVRRQLTTPHEVIDESIESQAQTSLYLNENRPSWRTERRKYLTRKSLRATLDSSSLQEKECDADITLVESDDCEMRESSDKQNAMTAKLLQFHTNTRPAYYGTWSKTSKRINGRCPFNKDENVLEYDYDSDDEWEEEEPGESLSSPEDENEDDNNEIEDDDDKDGFFVPHGYLSDDEGIDSDDGGDKESRPKEQCSYETEWSKKSKSLRPIVASYFPALDFDCELPTILSNLKIEIIGDFPIDVQSLCRAQTKRDHDEKSSVKRGASIQPVPEEGVPHLIKHVHGSHFGLNKLIVSFLQYWANPEMFADLPNRQPISKRQLERKILTIAERKSSEQQKIGRYVVHPQVLAKYSLDNLTEADNSQIHSTGSA